MADAIQDFLNKVANDLQSKQLKVGFINGATYPDGTKVSQVAAKNEYGEPAEHVPPRPFFRNAISSHSQEWADAIRRGILAGHRVEVVLEQVGALAASDVYTSITQLMEPPLSARTIRERQERGNYSTKPLEDSKIMINSISYEITDVEQGDEPA